MLAIEKEELKRLNTEEGKELETELSRQIIANHLHEVRGVSGKLVQTIMLNVFDGSLRSLHRADQVPGIGDLRQWDINRWVRKYEVKLPQLLQQDFPGKANIEAQYRPAIQARARRVQELGIQHATLEARVARLRQEFAWLKKVTSENFYEARLDPTRGAELVDRYVQGVFSEWEPMPEWFQEAIGATIPERTIATQSTPSSGNSSESEGTRLQVRQELPTVTLSEDRSDFQMLDPESAEMQIRALPVGTRLWYDDIATRKVVNRVLLGQRFTKKYYEIGHYSEWTRESTIYRVYHDTPGHPTCRRAIERIA